VSERDKEGRRDKIKKWAGMEGRSG